MVCGPSGGVVVIRCYTFVQPDGARAACRMEARRREKPAGAFLAQVAATLADLRAMGCTEIRRVSERQWREWT